jgi:N-acetylglutamate synthase-like GNAT family acetyltransferase
MSNETSIKIQDFHTTHPDNLETIERIVRWSSREMMVPITMDSIQRHHLSMVATDTGLDKVVGYGAITEIYSRNVVELGGLIIDSSYRGQGVASGIVRRLVDKALDVFNPAQILAFSNGTSANLFSKMGGVQIEDAGLLSAEVWKMCHLCRNYDEQVLTLGKVCCGRVYDLREIGGAHE